MMNDHRGTLCNVHDECCRSAVLCVMYTMSDVVERGTMGWLQLVGSIQSYPLQKSPIKESIFCKRNM